MRSLGRRYEERKRELLEAGLSGRQLAAIARWQAAGTLASADARRGSGQPWKRDKNAPYMRGAESPGAESRARRWEALAEKEGSSTMGGLYRERAAEVRRGASGNENARRGEVVTTTGVLYGRDNAGRRRKLPPGRYPIWSASDDRWVAQLDGKNISIQGPPPGRIAPPVLSPQDEADRGMLNYPEGAASPGLPSEPEGPGDIHIASGLAEIADDEGDAGFGENAETLFRVVDALEGGASPSPDDVNFAVNFLDKRGDAAESDAEADEWYAYAKRLAELYAS